MNIITNNKAVLKLIKSHNNGLIKKASNHTNSFCFSGQEYLYSGEIEPHSHNERFFPAIWHVVFYAADEDFFFVYRYKGKLHVVSPILGKYYSFDSTKKHAFIHKSKVSFFMKRNFWKNYIPENTIRCIFSFLES